MKMLSDIYVVIVFAHVQMSSVSVVFTLVKDVSCTAGLTGFMRTGSELRLLYNLALWSAIHVHIHY